MRYRLISVGKIREPYVAAAVDDFRNRLRRYDAVDDVEVASSRGDRPADAMREEAERILRIIEPGETVWLLERSGSAFSSPELASRIREAELEGRSRLTIVIAGTFGAGEPLRRRADVLWSLGPPTFLHEWVRAIVLEQLYRAAKINRDEPYHH